MRLLHRLPTQKHRPRVALSSVCRRVESAWSQGFREGTLKDLRGAATSLPLLVRCAVRVHERREARVSVFALDYVCAGRVERRFVVVAPVQGYVLVFSPGGVLDAAGHISAPVPGVRWKRIEWATRLHEQNWY